MDDYEDSTRGVSLLHRLWILANSMVYQMAHIRQQEDHVFGVNVEVSNRTALCQDLLDIALEGDKLFLVHSFTPALSFSI